MQKQRSFGDSTGGGGSVGTSAANKVKRGDLRHAIVVRTRKKLQRKDGSVVRFDDNACVLISKAGEPIGTRLNGEWSCLRSIKLLDPWWAALIYSFAVETVRGDVSVRSQQLIHRHPGIVGAELRDKQWSKILSLAPMHL